MLRKIVFAGVGIAMLATPLLASAQTTTNNTSLIAIFTQLVQVLEQEVQQLLGMHSATPMQPTTVAPTPANSFANLCAAYAHLQKGDTDATTGGQVSQLQAFLGISPTTGTYGDLTSIGYTNKCVGGNTQPTSVPGMSKYTDSDFGFSFWYPSGWTVTVSSTKNSYLEDQTGNSFYSGDTYVKSLVVSNGTHSILLDEYTSSDGLTMYSKAFDKLFFDSTKEEWVEESAEGGGTTPFDTSMNTMGGLHIFSKSVVPLSAENFVVSGNGSDGLAVALLNTIVATDPTVAIPESTAYQAVTIQQEAAAYGVTISSTPAVHPLTTVGSCLQTTVQQIGYRLVGPQGPNPDSGSAIWYSDGLYQVSYLTVPGIANSQVGDAVTVCLKSMPSNCPAGDSRGYVYDATNVRTGDTWEAADSEHECGGA